MTHIACNEKTRDKSGSYRILNVAFYSLAVVAMVAQWVARSTVGRLKWLDDGNMVVVLALDTVLFAVCYKMSFTGLGRDMWNVPFSGITSTLLVRTLIKQSYIQLTTLTVFLDQRNRLLYDSWIHQAFLPPLLPSNLPREKV
jgi:hypothetical protein